jgi:hypothetical protein
LSASSVLYAQTMNCLGAVAVDGRAGRSTWIESHGRNLWLCECHGIVAFERRHLCRSRDVAEALRGVCAV